MKTLAAVLALVIVSSQALAESIVKISSWDQMDAVQQVPAVQDETVTHATSGLYATKTDEICGMELLQKIHDAVVGTYDDEQLYVGWMMFCLIEDQPMPVRFSIRVSVQARTFGGEPEVERFLAARSGQVLFGNEIVFRRVRGVFATVSFEAGIKEPGPLGEFSLIDSLEDELWFSSQIAADAYASKTALGPLAEPDAEVLLGYLGRQFGSLLDDVEARYRKDVLPVVNFLTLRIHETYVYEDGGTGPAIPRVNTSGVRDCRETPTGTCLLGSGN